MAACEASLGRLDTDYIDLCQVHGFDQLTHIEETLRALDDLVRQGKVRYPGCSNWHARGLMKALCLAEARGWERFVSLQAYYYCLAGRDLEHELLPLCREEGLGVLPWSPLSGGFLTGKYRGASGPGGARRSGFDFPPVDQERGFDVVEALDGMAREKGASIPQTGSGLAAGAAGREFRDHRREQNGATGRQLKISGRNALGRGGGTARRDYPAAGVVSAVDGGAPKQPRAVRRNVLRNSRKTWRPAPLHSSF